VTSQSSDEYNIQTTKKLEIDSNRLFRWLLALIMILYTILLLKYSRGRASNEPEYNKAVKKDKIILTLFLSYQIISIFLYFVFPTTISWADVQFNNIVRSSGFLISLFSIAALFYLIGILGNNFSPIINIKTVHELSINGIYSWIRHPIYSTYIVFYIAIFLISSNFVVGFSWFIIYLFFVRYRISKEEELLIYQFGDEYRDYIKNTGCFVPKIKNFKNPDTTSNKE
jgi:protein-S-isoprenylcysteine O-methyltransferase Ste14